jgi:hypothetical protein
MKDRGSQTDAVNSDDDLGTVAFTGSDGTNYRGGAAIRAVAAANYGPIVDATGGSPGGLEFGTTPAGSNDVEDRLSIRSDGNVLIGTAINRGALLQVGANRGTNIITPYFCAGDGIITKYYNDGGIGATQRKRFTFAVGSRDSALVEIGVIGRRATSNTATQFETGIFAFRLFSQSNGPVGIHGQTMMMGYGVTATNFVFTSNGDNTCTIDFDNPTPNSDVTFAFDIHLLQPIGNQVRITAVETINE